MHIEPVGIGIRSLYPAVFRSAVGRLSAAFIAKGPPERMNR
jgi:hypothetical protein